MPKWGIVLAAVVGVSIGGFITYAAILRADVLYQRALNERFLLAYGAVLESGAHGLVVPRSALHVV